MVSTIMIEIFGRDRTQGTDHALSNKEENIQHHEKKNTGNL